MLSGARTGAEDGTGAAQRAWPVRQLGHGVGLRHQHFSELLERPPAAVSWFEIISENFFEPGGRPWAVLEKIRSDLPVVMHGVSMGVGNADGVSDDYLARLAEVVKRVEPVWLSDHLCWGAYGGHYAHDLLPLPYTDEVIGHVIAQVRKVQDVLGRRLMLENVSSYVAFEDSRLTEWEFLTAIIEGADCGLLLDVNNIYVSAHNHGFDPREFIDGVPAQRVGQIHLAGHSRQGELLLDTHIGPVPDPVWELYQYALRRLGPVPTLVEWDAEIPPFEVVEAEAVRAAALEAEVLGEGGQHVG